MKRTCLECKQGLHGRTDKKFCSDQCRTAYHNHRSKAAFPEIKTINHALRTNRRILERFAHSAVVPRLVLIKNGFDFTYSTHSTRGKNGQLYRHVYEQAYLEIDAERVCVLPRTITP